MAYYPSIDLSLVASLTTIRLMLDNNPDYLDDKACPYDAATIADLKELLKPKVKVVKQVVEKIIERPTEAVSTGVDPSAGPVKLKESAIPIEDVEAEIRDIKDELKRLKVESVGLDTNDQVQIIKTRASLVEKMVDFKERITNVKRLSNFQSVVLGILDDLIQDEKRLEFIKRLEPFLD